MLKRYHLIEIADQPWCPAAVRDGLTDYLQFAITMGNAYAPVVQPLANALRSSNARAVIDLCSGAGGPWITLQKELLKDGVDVSVTLTDFNPNSEAFLRIEEQTNGAIRGVPVPVDAKSPSTDLHGFLTMFSAFHHFPPSDARRILVDAASRGEGIAIFEGTRRSAGAILATALSAVLVLLFTPFIRPFRLSRLFWTYIIPLIPLVVLFDGVVSCLRTYTSDELIALTNGLGNDGQGDRTRYSWTAGELRTKGTGIPVTYVIGTPDHLTTASSTTHPAVQAPIELANSPLVHTHHA